MTPNHRPILYTAHTRRRRPSRTALEEFILSVIVCGVVSLLALGMLGYMDQADERAVATMSGRVTDTPR